MFLSNVCVWQIGHKHQATRLMFLALHQAKHWKVENRLKHQASRLVFKSIFKDLKMTALR